MQLFPLPLATLSCLRYLDLGVVRPWRQRHRKAKSLSMVAYYKNADDACLSHLLVTSIPHSLSDAALQASCSRLLLPWISGCMIDPPPPTSGSVVMELCLHAGG